MSGSRANHLVNVTAVEYNKVDLLVRLLLNQLQVLDHVNAMFSQVVAY